MALNRQNLIDFIKTLKVNIKDKTEKEIIAEIKPLVKTYLKEQKGLGNLKVDRIQFKTIDKDGHIKLAYRDIDAVKQVMDDIKSYLSTLGLIKQKGAIK